MKIKSLLVQIRPRCFARWRCLPLFGPLLDDFLRWMHDQHYTDSTLDSHLAGLRKVVVWLGRRRITKLAQLTQKDLQAAHDLYMANYCSGCNWQLKQPVAMTLPTVILKAGRLGCWAAGLLIRRVAG